jgi:Spy/CpxP family protein refolding chaperone
MTDPTTPTPATPPTPPTPPVPPVASTGTDPAATSGTTPAATTGKVFNIPQAVLDKYPDLVEMIKKSESMADEERDYWFQILPIMTDEQVDRLRKILTEESEQLAKLDTQYQDELSKLNKKHVEEWDNLEREKAREQMKQAEATAESAEKASEEDILNQLNNL